MQRHLRKRPRILMVTPGIPALPSGMGKHADAEVVRISIGVHAGVILLSVSDNGTVFDVVRVLDMKRHKGLGIIGMRERAEMLGGHVTVESVPGKGTTVLVEVPYDDPNPGR